MQLASLIAVAVVGVIHLAIAAVEMFFWQVPTVHQRLGFTAEIASLVAPIVHNAGLYNAFIAAGLLWGSLSKQTSVRLFFLVCVLIAGLYGAITLKPTTLVLQSLPAAVALITVLAQSRVGYQSKLQS